MAKRFWVPYAAYDVESIRMWLEEKADEGYRLKMMKPYFAVFEETDREHLKFHLEPTLKDAREPESEVVEAHADRGWTYAGTLADHFHVYYAEKDTPDFYMDPHSVKWKYEEKLKKERRGIFWSIPGFLLLFLLDLDFLNGFSDPILWMLQNLQVYHLLYLSFIVLGLMTKVITYRRYKKYVENLDEKEDFQTPSTGIFRMVNLIGNFLFYGAAIGILLFAFSADQEMYGYLEIEDLDFEPVITLEEIEELKDPDFREKEAFDYGNYASVRKSIFLNDQIVIDENLWIINRYSPGLQTTYYQVSSQWILNFFEDRLISRVEKSTGDTDSIRETYGNVSVSYFDVPELRTMILRMENRLMVVNYRGRVDLKSFKELIAERFSASMENALAESE